ncbi:MAG: helix-hairpin-helix domain-containing protein [Rhodanobacteraceae bacterium]|jgi:competence protein ComEA|nr:helix-hairpin-helix domain-containing protein [Rhodanobacteraceae bacterium]
MHLIHRLLLALLCALPSLAAAQVDINSADAKTLAASLAGVGLVKAEAIVAYRNTHGPFESVEDLAKVNGIGSKTIDANRDAIVVVRPGRARQAARQTDMAQPPTAP